MFGSFISSGYVFLDIPFDGPIAGVDVGRVNGGCDNPTTEQKKTQISNYL